MTRRWLVALAALLSLASPAAARPVSVDGGAIDGITLPSGVRAWLGIPFAAPPVRDLRWRAPAPVVPWRGVRAADRPAPQCLQPLRSPMQNHYFGVEATSEDCLYLNIWAPRSGRNLPVVVWIYGGGFTIGSASMANYSGEGLAADGVVRVNIAYRVGALGFLAHPELSEESGGAGSGNYGLMDQIAALQWVRRNIARFGGNPGNVTIVGQSAGSMSVALLQQSPQAHGLFQRAVGMSGSPYGALLRPLDLPAAEAQGLAFQTALGATSLADLRAMPGDRIISAPPLRDPITIDGHVLPVAGAGRPVSDVPLLIGYTRDESFAPLPPIDSRDALAQAVTERFGANAGAILSAYQGVDAARSARDIARDASVGVQTAGWAMAQAREMAAPVYTYLFARRQPYAPGVRFIDHDPATAGAYHTGDVPYWLRTRDSLNLYRTTRLWERVDQAIETDMASALLAFARTGHPRSPTIGDWPAFDASAPRMVWLGEERRVIDWPHWAIMPLLAQGRSEPAAPRRPRD